MRDFIDGNLTAVPAGSANGTPIMAGINRVSGILIYLAAGESVTYAIATAPPGAPPALTVTVSGDEMRRVDEPLGPGTMLYVTAKVGSPKFRAY